jgi:hypothetical protein
MSSSYEHRDASELRTPRLISRRAHDRDSDSGRRAEPPETQALDAGRGRRVRVALCRRDTEGRREVTVRVAAD